MSLSFPAAQVPLIERPHGEPLYFAHIYLSGETLYFSDRNFKFNGHDYEAYLFDIPETVQSIEQFGGYLNVNAQLRFRNLRFRSYDRLIDFFMANPLLREEMDLFVLYISDGVIPGSDLSTKLHKFSFGEYDEIAYETFGIELFSILHSLDPKKLLIEINRVNWPNAAPNDVGKYENQIFGQIRDAPCNFIETGAATTLAQDAAANATEIYLTETDYPIPFPSSGQVQVGFCIITYTGKDSSLKKLTGCTWSIPARAKKKGEPVWEIRSSYKVLANSNYGAIKTKSISNVKVAGVKVADADRTVNLDDNGKSIISFTSKNLLKNQGAHLHGALINEEYRPTGASFTYDTGMGASGVAANLKDLDDSTFCHVGVTGTLGSAKDAYFTATFPGYTGQAPDAVYACILCDWNLGYLANEYFKITTPEIIAIGVQGTSSTKYIARIKLTGTSVPGTLTCRAHTDAGNPVNLIVNVYEMWLELEFSNVPSGGENSVWEKLAPLVTCDIEGYKDDASGTYTGAANALIENPSDQRRLLLQGILGRSASEIGDSFAAVRSTYASRIAGGYKFGFILSEMGRKPDEIFRRLDEQSRSQMREDGGKFELSFHGDSEPASVMTIDKTIYIGEPKFSQTPAMDVRNVIRAVYDFDWSRTKQGGRYGNYFKQMEIPNLNGQRMLANFDGTQGQTSFTDPYGNVFTGYNGAIISEVAKKFGAASIRLPGSDGHFRVPSAPLNQFTLECFFRMDNHLTAVGQMIFVGLTSYKFEAAFSGNSQKMTFYIGNGSSWDPAAFGSKTSWENNIWYHVEFSFDGTTYRLFIDGILDVIQANSRIIGSISSLRLGSSYATNSLAGYIDEFRFSPECLHTANFTPPSAPYSPDIITNVLAEDIEYLGIQNPDMTRDVATWRQLQRKDVISRVELMARKQTAILQRGDYFVLNDVPVVSWEGKKWRVLEIRPTPDRQQFQIKAIQYIS